MQVVALFGPTGVGKSCVALSLARLLRERGEDPIAISAVALQVYRGLETLTGAASAREQAELEHRLLSFLDPSETFSAGEFAERAHAEIDAALAAGRRPVVVGGTGLYLQAALTDLELRPPPDPAIRAAVTARLDDLGPERLHAELAARAPTTAAAIDPRDRTRVGRALELLEMGEDPAPGGADSRLWTAKLRHPTLLCGLTMERAALGFEELLGGDQEAMKRRTRNYAKRQLAWMRRLRDVHRIDLTDREPDTAAAEIARILPRP